jgi:hypothetical protein
MGKCTCKRMCSNDTRIKPGHSPRRPGPLACSAGGAAARARPRPPPPPPVLQAGERPGQRARAPGEAALTCGAGRAAAGHAKCALSGSPRRGRGTSATSRSRGATPAALACAGSAPRGPAATLSSAARCRPRRASAAASRDPTRGARLASASSDVNVAAYVAPLPAQGGSVLAQCNAKGCAAHSVQPAQLHHEGACMVGRAGYFAGPCIRGMA